ncbi:biotin--[acetyl-CoA-carboxylase] ligase [Rhizomonospora bruguierae]|uniref:biotin--[acetyl-CoA-carboxylase] ligase n=1 Tax=Rhizomonospora bruguierae TaxID=1581705 RepID=UPI001BCC01EB|nr:biotin--[acetyl-CoA-carboxylase] ligase [Micromonospora sp. NBRC 107566]
MTQSPYTDLDRPPLHPAGLRRALLVPGGLWTRLDLRAATGSTNADAAAAARAGEPEGLVVVAEQQTAGRGRQGRQWTSPPRAGLAVSVLLRPAVAHPERAWPAVDPARFGWLPLLAGVALAEAVSRLAEVEAALKWPNDLLIAERKCGGILAEAVGEGVVVGIGLNVTLRADELPETAGAVPATSLRLAGATATDRDPLLRALLRALSDWYDRWRLAGGDAEKCGLRAAYLRDSATIGREVRVLLPAEADLTGTATGLDADGRLLVTDSATGASRAVAAGDIRHLR